MTVMSGVCVLPDFIDSMQLADELPMIYTVCILSYAAFTRDKPARTRALVGISIVGLATFITVCGPVLP